MNKDYQATVIKIAAVVSATSRWVGALMAAEGFDILEAWAVWWIPLSALLSAAMAVVEGVAFAYIFGAWRDSKDNDRWLLIIALLSGMVFVFVLTPYISAEVIDQPLASVLSWRPALYTWSAAVAASTIVIVAGVGYAERRRHENVRSSHLNDTSPTEPVKVERVDMTGQCWCGEPCYVQDVEDWYIDHVLRVHVPQVAHYGSGVEAWETLSSVYGENDNVAQFPSVAEIARWRSGSTPIYTKKS